MAYIRNQFSLYVMPNTYYFSYNKHCQMINKNNVEQQKTTKSVYSKRIG